MVGSVRGPEQGRGGLHYVVLDLHGDGLHTCEVCIFGATIVSWKQNGDEKLFVSDLAVFDGHKPIRGGIPIVFPQFSQPNPAMPQHGFARTSAWAFMGSRVTSEVCQATFGLRPSDESKALWPYDFFLVYEVSLTETSLSCVLHTINPSAEESFNCQMLLHTYLRVKDIHSICLKGFDGLNYADKLLNGQICAEERQIIAIREEVDRVYHPDPSGADRLIDVLSQSDQSLLARVKSSAVRTQMSDASLQAIADSFDGGSGAVIPPAEDSFKVNEEVDRVLWNAWTERSRAIADLQDDGYLHYVCVEPGLVSRPCHVPAKSRVSLHQELHLL